VDPAPAVLRAPGPAALAEGPSAPTPNRVTGALRAAEGLRAAALAEAVGVFRITVRRYGQVRRPGLVHGLVRCTAG
jgi:hypothetical protein